MNEPYSPAREAQPPASRGPIFWLKAARAPFFTGSLAPVLVGTAAAFYHSGSIDWLRALLALLAITALHAGANLANDYYDHLSGNDEINLTRAWPFTGGSRFIQEGWARPREILAASLISIAFGALIGLYFVSLLGWPILLLGLFGAATGFFYTASPLRLGYRGLGEIVIFLDFGLLPVLGAHYVQTETFPPIAALAGCVVGLLMTNVLWINQFQDAEADAAVGKRHWVVRLGPRCSAVVHPALFVAAYGLIAAGIAADILPAWSSLAFLSAPLALLAAGVGLRHYDHLDRLRPANIATIAAHLATAVLLAIGLALAR